MEPRRIDDQIRDYYARQRLSADERARLKTMIASGQPVAANRWWWLKTGVAAAFVLFVTTAALWLAVFRGAAPESPQLTAAIIARQAAAGHNEKQELDFRVDDCAELRKQMKSLDFAPVEPSLIRHMNMRVVGARYTTLQGKIAAQIVYVDPKGVPCTLYQVRPVDKLARIATGEHEVDGLRVSVWREKGLIMVLARPVG